jgi:FkbM family methyltransferase
VPYIALGTPTDMWIKRAKSVGITSMNAVWGALRRNNFVYNACLRAGVRLPTIPVRLIEYYGQCGEDLIVVSLVEAEAVRDGTDLGKAKYLEIGGNHPFATSATFLLHKKLNMHGVIVDANPALILELRKGRPRDTIVHAAIHDDNASIARLVLSKFDEISSLDRSMVQRWDGGKAGEAGVIEVPAMRINDVVRRYLGDTAPFFLSIDVEGYDLRLLRDFDFSRYQPRFVQVEYVDNLYPPGNSRDIIDYMCSVGYVLTAKTDVNLIFSAHEAAD